MALVMRNYWHNAQSQAASCHLSLHACNQSLFARGLSIDSLAYIIIQHARWPIRTLHPTYANQDAWVVITPRRSKGNSMHTAAWHNWTRTPALNIVQKDLFSLIHFPPHLSIFGYRAILIWGDQYMAGASLLTLASMPGRRNHVKETGIYKGFSNWCILSNTPT